MTDRDRPGGGSGALTTDGRSRAVLLLLSANMILDAIEVSLVLVALPTIGHATGRGPGTVQWLMSGFALGFAALLVPGRRLAGTLGRKRVFLAALALFAAASVVGGLAHGTGLLIAARVVKGGAAALTAPTGLAIIGTVFPPGPAQRRAVTVYSLFGAFGFTAGLLLSGALLEASWRWTLLLPAPVAVLLLGLGAWLLPPDPAPGTSAPESVRVSALLRQGSLLRSALGACALNGSYQGLLLLAVYQTQRQLHWAPWQSAVALLPACLPLALTTPFAAALTGRWGTARPIAVGAAAPVLGCAVFLWRGDAGYAGAVLPALLLVGAGLAAAFAALNLQAMTAIPPADRPAAVPVYQTAVQLGGAVALPVTAALLAAHRSPRPALVFLTAFAALGLPPGLAGLAAKPPALQLVPQQPSKEGQVAS